MEKQCIRYTVSPLGKQSYILDTEQDAKRLAETISADRGVYVSVWASGEQPRLIAVYNPSK
jgi:hypothetical protein